MVRDFYCILDICINYLLVQSWQSTVRPRLSREGERFDGPLVKETDGLCACIVPDKTDATTKCSQANLQTAGACGSKDRCSHSD